MEGKPAVSLVFSHLRDSNHNDELRFLPLIAFTDEGPVADEILEQIYCDTWTDPSGRPSFHDLNDLKKYAFLLSQKLNKWGCYLLSADVYNESLSSVHNRQDFQHLFAKAGEIILNDEYQKNRGIFKKIFN